MVKGLDPILLQRVRDSLLRCDLFCSEAELRPFFVDARLAQWASHLPSGRNQKMLVRAIIAYLYGQMTHQGENVLAIFLQVLSEQALGFWQAELKQLAQELSSSSMKRYRLILKQQTRCLKVGVRTK